eukprot:jgi/Tetstr1/457348/TSEL_043951.t1
MGTPAPSDTTVVAADWAAPSPERGDPLGVCTNTPQSAVLRLFLAYRQEPLDDYLSEELLPRLFAWALPAALFGMLLLLGLCIWRSIVRCCSPACAKRRRGSRTDSEVFSRRWFKGLSGSVVVVALAALICSIVGIVYCATAGNVLYPTVKTVQSFTQELRWGLRDVLEEGAGVVATALDVHDYVESNLGLSALESNITCATAAITTDNDPMGDIITGIATVTLPTVNNVLTTLGQLQNWYLPTMIGATTTLGGAPAWKQTLATDAGDAAAALNALAGSTQGSGAADASMDATSSALQELDISARVAEGQALLQAMDDLDALAASDVLDSLSGNLTALVDQLSGLRALLVVDRNITLDETLACAQHVVDALIHINGTLLILPAEHQVALATAQGVLLAVDEVLGAGGELADRVSRLDNIIGQLNAVLGAVSTALNLVFIPSAGAARAHYQQIQAALLAAEGPVNTALAEILQFGPSGGRTANEWAALMATVTEAESALQAVVAATPNPGFVQQAQIAVYLGYMNVLRAPATKLQSALSGKVADTVAEYSGYMAAIEDQLGGLDTARMEELMRQLEDEIEGVVVVAREAQEKMDQVEAVLTQVDQEIAEYLGKLPPEGSVAPAALRAEDALWVGYYVQLAVSLMLFVVAMLLSAGLIATQFALVQSVATGLTFASATMMMLTFLTFIPYGAAAQFTSDLCVNMEVWIYEIANQLIASPTAEVTVGAVLDFYLYGTNFISSEQMLLSAFGVQQDSIEALLADVREQAQGALDEYGLVLHPALLAQLRPLADQMQTLLVHVYGVLELISFDSVNSLYLRVKDGLCCDVLPKMVAIWRSMFVLGSFLSAAVLLMLWYLEVLDSLRQPRRACCACRPVRFPWAPSRWDADHEERSEGSRKPEAAPIAMPASPEGKKATMDSGKTVSVKEVELSTETHGKDGALEVAA